MAKKIVVSTMGALYAEMDCIQYPVQHVSGMDYRFYNLSRRQTVGVMIFQQIPDSQKNISVQALQNRYGIDKSRYFIYLIIVIVLLCFWPVLEGTYVWDDRFFILENSRYRGITCKTLKWMFTTFLDANYHPLYWMSFAMDHKLWQTNLTGYHFTSLLFHISNTVLAYFFILKILALPDIRQSVEPDGSEKSTAFMGALFFGIHPLRVEPVAWLCARADLLACFFLLLTIMCYLNMTDPYRRAEKCRWLILSLTFFLLSLLSRAWGVTLPAVLLVIDVFLLNRIRRDGSRVDSYISVFIDKIPFVILAVPFCVLALIAKQHAMVPISSHDLFGRVVQSTFGIMFYVFKTIIPIHLSPLYLPKSGSFNPFETVYIFCFILFVFMTLFLFAMRHRAKWAIVTVASFVIITSPNLGIFQAGQQIAADRYTYISCLPFAILFSSGINYANSKFKKRRSSIMLSLITIFISFALLCNSQSRIWKNDVTLWTHVIKLNPQNDYALNYRGMSRIIRGDIQNGLKDLNLAIRNNPYQAKAYNNRGSVRLAQNDFDRALSDFNHALKINPGYAEAYGNRGIAYYKKKEYQRAIESFDIALKLAPLNWNFAKMVKDFKQKSKQEISKRQAPP